MHHTVMHTTTDPIARCQSGSGMSSSLPASRESAGGGEKMSMTAPVRSSEDGNGYQVWKAFCDEWDPKEKGRCAAMLTSILNTRFPAEVWQEIETWETRIQKYEELSEEKVSESIRRSVVTNNCDHE